MLAWTQIDAIQVAARGKLAVTTGTTLNRKDCDSLLHKFAQPFATLFASAAGTVSRFVSLVAFEGKYCNIGNVQRVTASLFVRTCTTPRYLAVECGAVSDHECVSPKAVRRQFTKWEEFSKLAWRVTERDPMEGSKHSRITWARERGQTKQFQGINFSETEST